MKYNNYSFTKEANSYYDEGLRAYMLSIYQNMSLALGISALVAYIVGNSAPVAMMIFTTPLVYVVMFAPLIHIFFFLKDVKTDTHKLN